MCIDRQPAAPVLPSLADNGLAVPADSGAAVVSPGEPRSEKANAPDSVRYSPGNRFITFHQILV